MSNVYIKMVLENVGCGLLIFLPPFGVLTVFGTGNATQVNTITTAINFSSYRFSRNL